MLAKITKGRDFYRCLAYVLGKAGAEVLESNMAGQTASELAHEFQLSQQQHQRQAIRRKTEKVVCHVSLSVEVGTNLDSETWGAIAQDYLNAMGFDQNQFVLVRHTDTQHDHVHIVVSRLRIDGTTVPDWLDYHQTETILRTLEEKYQLRPVQSSWQTTIKAPTVAEVRHFRRTQQPSVRTILQVAIDDAAEGNPSFATFSNRLQELGVSFRLRVTPAGVKGISYKFHNIAFPGYKLGKRYTWQGLKTYLGVQYESTDAATSQATATGINLTTGEREHDFINTLPHADDPTRTARTTRTSNQSSTQQAQAHSSSGQSRRKVNARSATSITTGGLSSTGASPIGGIESRINEPASTFRGSDRSDEPILAEPREYNHPHREVDQGIAGNQRQPATSHSSSEYANRTAAETVGYDRENSQSTPSTCPDQTQSNTDMRATGTLQSLDRLHCDSNGISYVSSTQTANSDREATSDAFTEVILPNQDYQNLWYQISEDIRSSNPVEKDLHVAHCALENGMSSQETHQILWQSPYVRWLSSKQGYAKTQNYISLTVKAASTHQKPLKFARHTQQRQKQESQQHTL